MKQRHVLYHTLAFIIGFSLVFALAGVLLQTALSYAAYSLQQALAKLGGIVIILFGLYLLGVLPQLKKSFHIKWKPKQTRWWTSFLFGAAFALGWSPCVGAVLGAVLTLAITQPTSAFFLLLSYAIGMSVPFLLIGIFTERAKQVVRKKALLSWSKPFGAILVVLGIIIFYNQLGGVASLGSIFVTIDQMLGSVVTLPIAFIAGLLSVLSPCTLPLLPTFLTYLASVDSISKQ